MNLFYKIIFCFVTLFSAAIVVFAQTSERDKGIELYKRGDSNVEAIRLLESASKAKTTQDDGEVWNYLGMAYLCQNRNKEALKALERAVKLIPANSTFHSNLAFVYLSQNKTNKAQSEAEAAVKSDPKNIAAYYVRGTANQKEGKFEAAISDADSAISISPDFASAYLLKSNSLLGSFEKIWQTAGNPVENLVLIKQATETLEICLQKCPQNNLRSVRENLEILSVYPDYFSRKENVGEIPVVPAQIDPNNSPVKIVSKPRANYTDAARQGNVQGTVTLAIVFGADAKIKRIVVLEGLGKGLSEETVTAASNIIFEPQKKDGKPVSVLKELIYIYNLLNFHYFHDYFTGVILGSLIGRLTITRR